MNDMQALAEHAARRSGRSAPARRNFTNELRAAQKEGKIVVASMLPAQGEQVLHTPRSKQDPQPWRYTDRHGCEWRYSGRECHAVHVCGNRLLSLATSEFVTCLKPVGHSKACSSTP